MTFACGRPSPMQPSEEGCGSVGAPRVALRSRAVRGRVVGHSLRRLTQCRRCCAGGRGPREALSDH
jgi:hypothetical protein